MNDIAFKDGESLNYHLKQVSTEKRKFETAAQAISRMILERGVEKVIRAGKNVYEFKYFREGKKHLVGWHDEMMKIVTFIKGAAEGGMAKEFALVLVGEPGNGKTFFIDFLCKGYRQFLTLPENRRYTFEFIGLDRLGNYGNIEVVQSQIFEDPMILAMNLFGSDSSEDAKNFIAEAGFDDNQIDKLYERYRPLGACSEYIWNEIKAYCNGDQRKMLEFVRVVPVPLVDSQGTVTTKYQSGDKITASKTDLLGDKDLTRMLNLKDPNNPYRINLREGIIPRAGGSGILFFDEKFKTKIDLLHVMLGVIQPPFGGYRCIELYGFKWPIDIFIFATSNTGEYNKFRNLNEESPITSRCSICYVGHNDDYKLQQELTNFALGEASSKTTILGEEMHVDPNLNYVASVSVVLTRLIHHQKLTPVQMMKLVAGEVAGEKGNKALDEVKSEANAHNDVTKRWAQKGLGHRELGKIFERQMAMSETNEGKCLFALDFFDAAEEIIRDYVDEKVDRDKCLKDLKVGRELARKRIKTTIFNAYMDDPEAIKKGVMAYINMIVGADPEEVGPDQRIVYKDPQTGETKSFKVDNRYIDAVEQRLGLGTGEQKQSFRSSMRKVYAQKRLSEPNYDFMDQQDLVRAVTDVRLDSDVAGASSLRGALANRTNDENKKLYNRMIETMLEKLGHCMTCSEKSIEYYTEVDDET